MRNVQLTQPTKKGKVELCCFQANNFLLPATTESLNLLIREFIAISEISLKWSNPRTSYLLMMGKSFALLLMSNRMEYMLKLEEVDY